MREKKFKRSTIEVSIYNLGRECLVEKWELCDKKDRRKKRIIHGEDKKGTSHGG